MEFGDVLLTTIAVLVVLCIWVILYDTNRFIIVKKQFSSNKIKKKKRFLLLADLHGKQFGKGNQLLLQAIEEQEPDGILLAGDMLTALKDFKQEPLLQVLEKLSEKYLVYYAYGNHEQKIGLYPEKFGDMAERYEAALQKIGIEPIRNLHVVLEDAGIRLYGLEVEHKYYKRFGRLPMPGGYLETLLGKKHPDSYTVLLAHNPDYFPEYAQWGADLVLSGHIHGGLMRLPLAGGVIAPSLRFFPKYDGGVFQEGESTMVLSRGIGGHFPNLRIFNPGELIVLDLCPEDMT